MSRSRKAKSFGGGFQDGKRKMQPYGKFNKACTCPCCITDDTSPYKTSERMACKAELRRKRLEGLEELVRLTEEFCGYAELESEAEPEVEKNSDKSLCSPVNLAEENPTMKMLTTYREFIKGVEVQTSLVESSDPATLREEIAKFVSDDQKVVVLGSLYQDNTVFIVASNASGVHAGQLVKKIAEYVGGAGGGTANLAQAGGGDPGLVQQALGGVPNLVSRQLELAKNSEAGGGSSDGTD